MGRLITLSILFCLLFMQAGFANAAEVEIFGIADDEEVRRSLSAEARIRLDSTLYRIDYKTGFASLVGPVGYHGCGGLDFHPITGQLYATCLGESHNPVLLNVDPYTGYGTKIFELQFENGDFGVIADISFRYDGTLFAYIESMAESYLAIINMHTGLIQNLGPVGILGEGNGIAFNDVLYNAQTDLLPTLNVLDQTNGAATFETNLIVPPPADDFPVIYSMDKDTVNNIFYGALDNQTVIYTFYLVTIDPDSGQVDLIGETVEGLQALAVRNPRISNVPTLSEYSMIALAVIFLGSALIVLRRRNQKIEA